MPIVSPSSFPGPPFYQFNGHLQTVMPALFRRVKGVHYRRERIDTPDGDFLDLDWLPKASSRHNRLPTLRRSGELEGF